MAYKLGTQRTTTSQDKTGTGAVIAAAVRTWNGKIIPSASCIWHNMMVCRAPRYATFYDVLCSFSPWAWAWAWAPRLSPVGFVIVFYFFCVFLTFKIIRSTLNIISTTDKETRPTTHIQTNNTQTTTNNNKHNKHTKAEATQKQHKSNKKQIK